MRFRREPLFLARQSYRRRRLEDAARLLPILGVFLFLLPLLATGAGTAGQGMYLFAAWFGLIVATAMISRGLNRWPDMSHDPDEEASSHTPAKPSDPTSQDEGRD
ncbi:hypothetical protein MUY35_03220 [Aliiroseovarius sp. S1339]|uniref:hypothetical protein n=1 Tax=Aliiroseovarius sp. S1339 TaxID=2936990 RepID=UPI0020C12E42|nr:hypothetical protein [Aliiroseovarius sp. S1339]MCK8462856.1 hypothetical protein [Aliiroseovarius sp. S1339]